MADYRLANVPPHDPGTVIRNFDEAVIPDDPLNLDRKAYNEWLAMPNVPDPATVIPLNVPPIISKRQFWMQLAALGHINETAALNAMDEDIPDVIETFILTLPAGERFAARMYFKSPTFERHMQAVTHTKATFALSDAQIDQFFRDAVLL